MPIKILSDEIASQIAAGEVIERPASVVKELIENSIDAGANEIIVKILNAGKDLIQVSDNGIGISGDEIEIALSRHSTSKINTAEDLFKIRTLGFRGEALASIASVSRIQIASCTLDCNIGTVLNADAGNVISIRKVGLPSGTDIKVEGLFYNVPARLKFLKTDSTEKRNISSLITKFGLAYPSIKFQLEMENNLVFSTSGNGNVREVLSSIYDIGTAKQLLEINLMDEKIEIKGFVSTINITRSNRKEINFYVNGRYIKDIALSTAVIQAYKNLIMVGRYPISVVFISLDPELVDVNVHPTKSEVRFSKPDYIFSCVQRAVRRGLLSYGDISTLPNKVWNYPSNEKFYSKGLLDGEDSINPISTTEEQELSDGIVHAPHEQEFQFNIPILRAIGQIGATYIVAEGPDGLYLIDQHAAHERILFEKILEEKEAKVASQDLIEGEVIFLSPQYSQILTEEIDVFNKLGFKIENFGQNTFIIRSIPAYINNHDPKGILQAALEDLEDGKEPFKMDLEDKIVSKICKKIAIKGGQVLSDVEQKELINELESCQSPRTCPHGRPTLIHLPVSLLERQFGRTGSI